MIQEITTRMPADAVLAAAKTFFVRRNPLYGVFPEKEGPDYVVFRGQGNEELVIGVTSVEAGTLVRGSTYLYDAQVARFLTTLDPLTMAEERVG